MQLVLQHSTSLQPDNVSVWMMEVIDTLMAMIIEAIAVIILLYLILFATLILATSPVSANRKPVASKPKNPSTTEEVPASNISKDSYVGRQVQSFVDYQGREYRIEGEVVLEQRRKRGARRVMYYKIQWGSRHSSKYDYKEHEWVTKRELLLILRG